MYVYGVLASDARLRLPSEGVGGRPVGRIEHEGLAALVSDGVEVPVRPSRRNVMAHSTVLQEAVTQTDVLPMRFGVVLPDEAAVRDELLAAHHDALAAELAACGGCVELSVTVTCPEEALLRAILAADSSLLTARGKVDAGGMQARIAFGEQVARAVEAERARVAET